MTENSQDIWGEAFAKQDEMKKEAELAGLGGGGSYENIKYLGLEKEQYIAFRPLGLPLEIRKENSDAKIVLRSDILNDAGTGYLKINFPYVETDGKYKPDPNHILMELYKAVNEGDYVEYTEADINGKDIVKNAAGIVVKKVKTSEYEKKKFFLHENTPSYQRVNNGKTSWSTFPPKFYPSARVIMPVISRMDSWCQENNHSMLLATKVGKKDKKLSDGTVKEVLYPDCGISYSLYLEFMENVRRIRKNWDTDFMIRRYQKADETWTEEISDYGLKDRLPAGIAEIMTDKPLTEAEKNYKFYDSDKNFKVVSYQKLEKNLIGLFKLVDSDLGTNFTERLIALAKQEKEQYREAAKKSAESKKAEAPVAETVVTNPEATGMEAHGKISTETVAVTETLIAETVTTAPDVAETTPSEEIVTNSRPARGSTPEGVSDEDLKAIFPHWNSLDEEDKKDVKIYAESIQGTEVAYKAGSEIMPCDNPDCKQLLPSSVRNCPKCGLKFK